jgi:hypothetical protein
MAIDGWAVMAKPIQFAFQNEGGEWILSVDAPDAPCRRRTLPAIAGQLTNLWNIS